MLVCEKWEPVYGISNLAMMSLRTAVSVQITFLLL